MRQVWALILLFCLASLQPVCSEEPPPNPKQEVLTVLVPIFDPPFTMRAGEGFYFGFDVDMMRYICKSIKRKCKFKPVPHRFIIPNLHKAKGDLGIGALAITLERSRLVEFSHPYFPSFSNFLINHRTLHKYGDNINLQKLKVGILKGTAIKKALLKKGFKAYNLKEYVIITDLILALDKNYVNVIIDDKPSAYYWGLKNESFEVYGKPLTYGYGFGIAISPKRHELLDPINKALQNYLLSPSFIADYNKYFEDLNLNL